ncbi:DUF536 domain-containing protein [Staphylococcus ureilyticus]
MKSMKEIADELNVTKMTVYNNAKKANVKFQKIDNVNYLSSEDENIVVNRIRKNQNKNDDFESEKKEEPNNDNLLKDETIKQLYNQIDIYKEQSNRDKEQINTLNRLLENQQVLALESNKKIQKLENQLEEERQLNYSLDTSTNDRQNVDAQEATYTNEHVNINHHQEEDKETEVQHKDIFESQSDEETKDEELQKENVPSNPNYNDSDIEEKREETQSKKGFWSRLFGG